MGGWGAVALQAKRHCGTTWRECHGTSSFSGGVQDLLVVSCGSLASLRMPSAQSTHTHTGTHTHFHTRTHVLLGDNTDPLLSAQAHVTVGRWWRLGRAGRVPSGTERRSRPTDGSCSTVTASSWHDAPFSSECVCVGVRA